MVSYVVKRSLVHPLYAPLTEASTATSTGATIFGVSSAPEAVRGKWRPRGGLEEGRTV